MEIRRILFPVDLAGSSHKIAPEVEAIADKFKAELHLLYVVGTLEQYSSFFVPHPSLDQLENEVILSAEDKLDEFARTFFKDRPRVKSRVLRGHPVEEILKYIDSAGVDMVVLALHDRHGLERAIVGNVAEEIAQRSPVPVMSINPDVVKAAQTWEFPVEKGVTREGGQPGSEL